MKVSLNWVKQFTAVDLPIDNLVEKIGAQLGAVEEVVDVSTKYTGILVVKVVECVKHPNADKLSLCLVDDGGADKKVKRNEQGLIQVVCGAPNVKAGMLAAWIPPGSTVPSSFDKEPFIIEARPIRNKTSHGMLASAKELDIGDDHSGIVEVDKDAQPGDNFAELYFMNDYIIDIENKMFTHRPDLFGMLGVAREIAGIQQQPFKSPDWYKEAAGLPADGRKNVLKLAVKNDVPDLLKRFCAVAIKDVKVGPSPVWLRASLSRVGVNSINNIVDLTNFYMLVTGQPLHAYDYDKLKTGVLGARLSKPGEQLALLNGKTIKLDHQAVVITDGHKPIGLAGVMGGSETEVDEHTKNIVLEVANFDMNATRRAAMAYGLFTDAATRFTKGQSPRQNLAVLCKAVEDILRLAGGRVASPVIDDKHFSAKTAELKVTKDFINDRLGLDLSLVEMKKLLANVEFEVETSGDSLKIKPPFWRTDIEIGEDIVEEIGRLYGYDHLPQSLPPRDLAPAELNPMLSFKSRLRDILKSAGANEVLTYSFVHGDLLKKIGQDPAQAYQLANALSPDLQYYRLSLTPSLLDKIHANQRAGFKEFALFELGLGHNKLQKTDGEEKVPAEFQILSLVFASSHKTTRQNGAPYYQARTILDFLGLRLGLSLDYRLFKEEEPYSVVKPFDHRRSAQVWDAKSQTFLGMVGEYKPAVIKNLKLPPYSAGFEVGIEHLQSAATPGEYQPLGRFPEVEQDVSLRAPAKLSYVKLAGFMAGQLEKLSQPHNYKFMWRPIDIFQKDGDKTHKQTTWRIILWHPERTLTTAETNQLLDKLAERAKQDLNAERI